MKKLHKAQFILSLLIPLCLSIYILLGMRQVGIENNVTKHLTEDIIGQHWMGRRAIRSLEIFIIISLIAYMLARRGYFYRHWIYRSKFRTVLNVLLALYIILVGVALFHGTVRFFRPTIVFILIHMVPYVRSIVLNVEYYLNYKNNKLEADPLIG